MNEIKLMVKKMAQYFGIEISRYPTALESTNLFPEWVSQLLSTGPLDVVFDIGANRGQTIALFRSEFPESTIYAFEPGLSAFSELRVRTESDSKVRSFQLALGEYNGRALLHQNAADVTDSLLTNSSRISQFAPAEMTAPKRARTVPIKRIDSFCAEESIHRIDLLKIDAQGYERHILAGAGDLLTPEVIRGLFIEVLFVDLYENQTWCGEVLESLRSRGYRLFGFTRVVYDHIYGWKWADAMFLED